jgi:uncharacterized protein
MKKNHCKLFSGNCFKTKGLKKISVNFVLIFSIILSFIPLLFSSDAQGASRKTAFGDPDKIDVLIVTSGHHFNRESFFGMFDYVDINYSEYVLKDESEVFEDISEWDYDVIFLYNMTQKISPKRQENFVRLMKEKGVGLVVMHHAQAAFQSWHEYHQIIGTAYIYFDVEIDGKPWPHGKVHEGLNIPIKVTDIQHPITQGMKDFEVIDETYMGRWWAKGNDVLLTTNHPENDEPIAWTRKYGKSKVFNIQLGHDEKAYNCREFRELIVRGIRWTAGLKTLDKATSSETVTDADGNIYNTVRIGSQVWTVENLRTTKFNDGTPIPNVTGAEAWKGLSTPGFCYYENKPEYGEKYGALYNWWAASSNKIAPKGWKVPTHEEQMVLRDCLIAIGDNFDGTKEGNKVAKSMTASTDWGPDSIPGNAGNDLTTNNRSGFTALPTGSRWNDGSFHAMGQSVYWWSTTKGDGEGSHMSSIHSRFAKYGNNQHHDRSGFCIRLLRIDTIEQASSIKGTVKNSSGAGLAGAKVQLEGTNQSTKTDAKGNFNMVLKGLAPVTKKVNDRGFVDYRRDVITVTKEGYLDYQIHVPAPEASKMAIEMIDCAGTVTDVDGNVYQTVKIGDQVWTTSSLRTTRYNDGTPIPNVIDNKEWNQLKSAACCYYDNKPEHAKIGLLYNWWAANHPKIAPKGWHVPTVEEQLTLRRYLVQNGYNCDGTKYPEWKGENDHEKDKENKVGKSMAGRIGWEYRIVDKQGKYWEKELLISERPELNNKTGFNGLPNGARWNDGSFHNLTGSYYMWSSTEQASDRGWLSSIHNWSRYLGDSHHVKETGFGLRLIKDKE